MKWADGEILQLAPETVPGIHVLPMVHERLDLAPVVVAALEALAPAAVAVELPHSFVEPVDRALRRLPELTLLLSQEPGEDALVWVATPGDPLVEALRWARQRHRPWFLIDPDVPYDERHRDPVPDPYSLWALGPVRYLAPVEEVAGAGAVTPADELREKGMAHRLQRVRRELDEQEQKGPIVALVGAAHAARLRDRLQRPTAAPLVRRRRAQIDVRHLHPESMTALLRDPPLGHAVWELIRGRDKLGETSPEDTSLEGTSLEDRSLSDTVERKVSFFRHGLRVLAGGKGNDDRERRRWAIPSYAVRHAARRVAVDRRAVDRRALGAVVWKIASASYLEQTQEETTPWQRRVFFDFCRRYARVQGTLVPGLFEWAVAARGVADDNLAWEVFDAGRSYPWQREVSDLPTVRVDGEELDLGTRKVRFRRRFFRVKQRPVRAPVRERPAAKDPAEWLEGFDSDGICSYPKEDILIEDYARFLQKKAVSLLTVENRKTEPFTTSMLDGIDVRETLRNLPGSSLQDGKIYVQELGRISGGAGSVVVIFDQDPEGSRYPYLMTWHGEHDQESDMAFYATDPFEQVVGPGITRATYGGFMMTYPPRRVFDVWEDGEYRTAGSKAEVLVLAAIDYSEEKLVVHVAAGPPTDRLKRYAAAQGKRMMHIPLAGLSPAALKKIRVVHMLAGHDKRRIAKEYIW